MGKSRRKKARFPVKRERFSDCCIFCEVYGRAVRDVPTGTVDERVDKLVVQLEGFQSFTGGYSPFLGLPGSEVEQSISEWIEPRDVGDESVQVAALTISRFWANHQEAAA